MQPSRDRPKLLLITRNLPPLVGGMERMMHQFAHGMHQYAELTVIGPKGCGQFLPGEIEVHETSSSLGSFLVFSTMLAIRACGKSKFNLIIGGSGLIGPTLRILSWLFRRNTLVYLHGLDLVVDNPLYQLLFVPSLRGIDSVAVNSRNTRDIAVEKGIAAQRLRVINPGTNLPDPIDSVSRLEFRQRHAIPFPRYLVFTGRMTKRKGLSEFLHRALPLILLSEPDIGLVVVGENPRDSLNRLGEEERILETISSLGLQKQVLFLGKLNDADLDICYAEASVQIFPLVFVQGDVEGFGMVAIEAAACGTPTVAFELGGVADAITNRNGYLVTPGDFESFAKCTIHALRAGEPSPDQCLAHARQFTWQIYNEKMRALIDETVR